MFLHNSPYCRFELPISSLPFPTYPLSMKGDLLESKLDPFSFLKLVIPPVTIHSDSQLLIWLDLISVLQLCHLR